MAAYYDPPTSASYPSSSSTSAGGSRFAPSIRVHHPQQQPARRRSGPSRLSLASAAHSRSSGRVGSTRHLEDLAFVRPRGVERQERALNDRLERLERASTGVAAGRPIKPTKLKSHAYEWQGRSSSTPEPHTPPPFSLSADFLHPQSAYYLDPSTAFPSHAPPLPTLDTWPPRPESAASDLPSGQPHRAEPAYTYSRPKEYVTASFEMDSAVMEWGRGEENGVYAPVWDERGAEGRDSPPLKAAAFNWRADERWPTDNSHVNQPSALARPPLEPHSHKPAHFTASTDHFVRAITDDYPTVYDHPGTDWADAHLTAPDGRTRMDGGGVGEIGWRQEWHGRTGGAGTWALAGEEGGRWYESLRGTVQHDPVPRSPPALHHPQPRYSSPPPFAAQHPDALTHQLHASPDLPGPEARYEDDLRGSSERLRRLDGVVGNWETYGAPSAHSADDQLRKTRPGDGQVDRKPSPSFLAQALNPDPRRSWTAPHPANLSRRSSSCDSLRTLEQPSAAPFPLDLRAHQEHRRAVLVSAGARPPADVASQRTPLPASTSPPTPLTASSVPRPAALSLSSSSSASPAPRRAPAARPRRAPKRLPNLSALARSFLDIEARVEGHASEDEESESEGSFLDDGEEEQEIEEGSESGSEDA